MPLAHAVKRAHGTRKKSKSKASSNSSTSSRRRHSISSASTQRAPTNDATSLVSTLLKEGSGVERAQRLKAQYRQPGAERERRVQMLARAAAPSNKESYRSRSAARCRSCSRSRSRSRSRVADAAPDVELGDGDRFVRPGPTHPDRDPLDIHPHAFLVNMAPHAELVPPLCKHDEYDDEDDFEQEDVSGQHERRGRSRAEKRVIAAATVYPYPSPRFSAPVSEEKEPTPSIAPVTRVEPKRRQQFSEPVEEEQKEPVASAPSDEAIQANVPAIQQQQQQYRRPSRSPPPSYPAGIPTEKSSQREAARKFFVSPPRARTAARNLESHLVLGQEGDSSTPRAHREQERMDPLSMRPAGRPSSSPELDAVANTARPRSKHNENQFNVYEHLGSEQAEGDEGLNRTYSCQELHELIRHQQYNPPKHEKDAERMNATLHRYATQTAPRSAWEAEQLEKLRELSIKQAQMNAVLARKNASRTRPEGPVAWWPDENHEASPSRSPSGRREGVNQHIDERDHQRKLARWIEQAERPAAGLPPRKTTPPPRRAPRVVSPTERGLVRRPRSSPAVRRKADYDRHDSRSPPSHAPPHAPPPAPKSPFRPLQSHHVSTYARTFRPLSQAAEPQALMGGSLRQHRYEQHAGAGDESASEESVGEYSFRNVREGEAREALEQSMRQQAEEMEAEAERDAAEKREATAFFIPVSPPRARAAKGAAQSRRASSRPPGVSRWAQRRSSVEGERRRPRPSSAAPVAASSSRAASQPRSSFSRRHERFIPDFDIDDDDDADVLAHAQQQQQHQRQSQGRVESEEDIAARLRRDQARDALKELVARHDAERAELERQQQIKMKATQQWLDQLERSPPINAAPSPGRPGLSSSFHRSPVRDGPTEPLYASHLSSFDAGIGRPSSWRPQYSDRPPPPPRDRRRRSYHPRADLDGSVRSVLSMAESPLVQAFQSEPVSRSMGSNASRSYYPPPPPPPPPTQSPLRWAPRPPSARPSPAKYELAAAPSVRSPQVHQSVSASVPSPPARSTPIRHTPGVPSSLTSSSPAVAPAPAPAPATYSYAHPSSSPSHAAAPPMMSPTSKNAWYERELARLKREQAEREAQRRASRGEEPRSTYRSPVRQSPVRPTTSPIRHSPPPQPPPSAYSQRAASRSPAPVAREMLDSSAYATLARSERERSRARTDAAMEEMHRQRIEAERRMEELTKQAMAEVQRPYTASRSPYASRKENRPHSSPKTFTGVSSTRAYQPPPRASAAVPSLPKSAFDTSSLSQISSLANTTGFQPSFHRGGTGVAVGADSSVTPSSISSTSTSPLLASQRPPASGGYRHRMRELSSESSTSVPSSPSSDSDIDRIRIPATVSKSGRARARAEAATERARGAAAAVGAVTAYRTRTGVTIRDGGVDDLSSVSDDHASIHSLSTEDELVADAAAEKFYGSVSRSRDHGSEAISVTISPVRRSRGRDRSPPTSASSSTYAVRVTVEEEKHA